MRYRFLLVALGVPLAIFVACSTDSGAFGDDGNGGSTTASSGSGGSSSGQGGDILPQGGFDPGQGGGTGTPGCVDADPTTDYDQDGFTEDQGDCNDCDANVNPNAIEVETPPDDGQGGGPPEPADENCDGEVDNVPGPCDDNLAVDSADPLDGARAIGLCKIASGPDDWGVVQADWTLPNGSPAPALPNFALGHGILSGFGPNVNVQEGTRMLALSSGTARQPNDPGYQSVGGFSKGIPDTGHPFGFPKESPSCASAVTGACNDGAALQLTVRAPSNATGFRFNFDFYTFEWPVFVCSTFNDFFAAILEPFPDGQADGNITFDQIGNPISVNNAFFEVCGCAGGPPCSAGGITFTCALGEGELQGTGYEGHAATSWLQTQAPLEGGAEFMIRFLAYDSGDGILDSTGLVDNWEWLAEPGVTVGTTPVPDPK